MDEKRGDDIWERGVVMGTATVPTRLGLCAASLVLVAGCQAIPGGTAAARASGRGTSAPADSMSPTASAAVPSGTKSGATGPSGVSRSAGTQEVPAPPHPVDVRWLPAPTLADGQPAAYTAQVSESTWAMKMDPQRLEFRFVPGTKEPAGGPRSAADKDARTWLSRICVAFNGAFKLDARAGGYYYLGRQVSPLRAGLGSVVVTDRGELQLGVWGRDFTTTDGLAAVRQNLPPIVDGGVSMVDSRKPLWVWGGDVHREIVTNRSAVARLVDGSLAYVVSKKVSPDRFAEQLVDMGAQVAVELDINGSWPVGVVYRHQGATVTGARLRPGQYWSGSVYDQPYERDFIAAMVPASMWRDGN